MYHKFIDKIHYTWSFKIDRSIIIGIFWKPEQLIKSHTVVYTETKSIHKETHMLYMGFTFICFIFFLNRYRETAEYITD